MECVDLDGKILIDIRSVKSTNSPISRTYYASLKLIYNETNIFRPTREINYSFRGNSKQIKHVRALNVSRLEKYILRKGEGYAASTI